MKTRAFLLICAIVACGTPPEFLPPPFGPGGSTPTRFFFPTGLAVLPDGSLLVANGNFNHAFDGGTVVSVRKSYLDAFFAQKLSCATATPVAACDDDVSAHPDEVFGGSVMIGNYAGPLAINDAGTLAYTGSRDTGRLNAIAIGPDLSLTCAPGAGTGRDCRAGAVDLSVSGVLGPFAVAAGDFTPPGQPSRRVVYVSSMIPRIDAISGGIVSGSAVVAAVDMADPTQLLFTMLAGVGVVGGGIGVGGAGVGAMVYDPTRKELLLGGCFERFSGSGAGEPATGRCSGISNNFLRFLDVDAQEGANVQSFDLYGDVLSIETTALLLADPDPVTQVPATLWATMRNPDVLVQIELPPQPSVAPRVRRVVPLPVSPAELVRIPRAGKADLLAVVSEKLGAVVIYDTGEQAIVAQVERLGDSPFSLKLVSSDATSARLVATVFSACSIALLEVPLDAPWNAALRGRAGRCP